MIETFLKKAGVSRDAEIFRSPLDRHAQTTCIAPIVSIQYPKEPYIFFLYSNKVFQTKRVVVVN
jgi:hypothetical protein